ncbi:hypothetical protein PS2_019630 [Malus domestica]
MKHTKIQEFLDLKQANMTVVEYVAKFTELSKYSDGQGPKTYHEIVEAAYELEQDYLFTQKNQNQYKGSGLRKMTKKSMRSEQGSSSGNGGYGFRRPGPIECYHCHEFGHTRDKCPKREVSGSIVTPPNRFQQPNRMETVQQPNRLQPGQQPQQRVPQRQNQGRGARARASGSGGRVFAVSGSNAGENTDGALDGMVLISSSEAHVLFDTGSSHSFVSLWFSYILGFQSKALARPLYLSVPLGYGDVVDQTYRSCHLLVNNQMLTADLYPLELKKYDLILGMDWLRKHCAIIDCEERKLKVCTLEGEEKIG